MRKSSPAGTVGFVAILLLSLSLVAQNQETSSPSALTAILGFSAAHAAAEHRVETEFQAIPSPERAREWHRTFTAEPHPAASERNNQLAEFVAEEWRKQGWEEVTLRRYEVLHSRPRSVSLEMTAPVHYAASLREDPVDADPDTKTLRFRARTLDIRLRVMSLQKWCTRTAGIRKITICCENMASASKEKLFWCVIRILIAIEDSKR